QNLSAFFQFLAAGDVDWAVAIGTTDTFLDSGTIRGPVVTRATEGAVDALSLAVKVGTGGTALEQGLQAARAILDADRAGTLSVKATGEVARFTRPDAYLFVVIVSDEDDHSAGDVRTWRRIVE